MPDPQQHTGVPDGWEVVAHAAPPPATAAPAGPPGSERTRQDTSMIGVNHEQLQQSIANWASKLSPAWQRPAAMIATFPADVLASLAEMFSSPEAVATGASTPKGAAVMDAAQAGAGKALDATGRLVERVGGVLEKPGRYIGMWSLLHDPVKGTVEIVAPKVAQAAGRGMQKAGAALAGGGAHGLSTADVLSLQKQGYSPQVIDRIDQQLLDARRGGAPPVTTAPARATPDDVRRAAVENAPAAPAPAATASPTPPPPARGATQPTKIRLTSEEFAAAQQLVKDGYDPQDVLHELVKARGVSLSPAEQAQVDRLVKAGKTKQQATEAIQAMRQLSIGLPSDAEVKAAVTDRNASGRWPEE